jgi:hypothetical protein
MRDTSVIDHYLAPLRPFLAPAPVTEVVVNRPQEVGVEHPDGWRWHEVPELTESWLRTLAVAAAACTGQDVDAERPICSTVLPGDARCQIVLPPVVPAGEPDRRAAELDRRAAQDDLQRQIEAFRRGQAEGGIPDPPRRTPSNPPALPKAPPRREPVAGKSAAPRGQEGGVRRSPAPTANRSAAAPARQGTPPANSPPPILGGHAGEIGRHVDGAFAHDLAHAGIRPGSSDQSAVAPQTVPTVAHELVAMFRDPKTIRQVILLREVLDRPIDRW